VQESQEKWGVVFEKQWLHYAFLLFAFVLIYQLFLLDTTLLEGSFLGLSTYLWFEIGLGLAVTHHLYVWFVWRTQLHFSLVTRTLGQHAFTYYAVGFSVIAILRVLAVFAVGIANAGTVSVSLVFLYSASAVLSIPMAYLFFSVQKYFGFERAFGIDHFDASYRGMPLVREGIFKYTHNGMYTFGALIVILPGLLFASRAALLLGVFNYLYVWVHYFALEKPDMKRIYGA
jgi:protein-S-isoprenylcysteine O-methyltransferase Ste14